MKKKNGSQISIATIANELSTAGVAQLIQPGDPDYDTARQVWNGDINRHPAIIIRCHGVADVIAAVNAARENDLPLAIRGGAHSAAGHGTCDNGVVIDLSSMKGIRIAPGQKTAIVQAGVVWSELDHESQAFGLATPGGLVSNTGVSGLTLGGGEGWLMGKYGLTVDNVLGMDVVTADGNYFHANQNENPDLFWALRGGGGNFGVVTSIEYQLHEHGPMVLGGMVIYPIADGHEVLRFYREFCADLPDEAEAFAGLLTIPDLGPVVAILAGYNGEIAEGERIFAPLRNFAEPAVDMISPMPHVQRQQLVDEGAVDHGPLRYWKSGYTENISDEFIDAVVSAAKNFTSPESSLLFFYVHGAAARVANDATAFALRGEKWDFNVISQWRDATESEQHKAWTRELWDQLEPLTTGAAYVNHLAGDDSAAKIRASFGSNYERLATIKAKYDPGNLFRLNANIQPES